MVEASSNRMHAVVRPEPEPREHPPVSRTVLWAAILAGPVAWVANHMLLYIISSWSCAKGTEWPLHATAALTALVCVAGFAIAWQAWQRSEPALGHDPGHPEEVSAPRSRFMGMIGMLASALFLSVIVSQWLPVLFLGPCMRSG